MWRAGPSGLAAATVALLIPALSHAATAWRSGLAEGASIHAPRQSGRGRLTEYTPEAEADRVLSLPGWGDLDHFSVFAGYAIACVVVATTNFVATVSQCRALPMHAEATLRDSQEEI
eukprot:352893-Chlamydomonas_euryale.AAC.8